MANVKATDLIDFTRASKGHALAKVSYGEEEAPQTSSGYQSNNATITDITNGVNVTVSTAFGEARIRESAVVGKIYKVVFTVTVNTGSIRFLWDDLSINDSLSSGTYEYVGVATDTEHTINFRANNDVSTDFDLTNVSVREVTFDQPDGTLQLFEHPEGIPRIEYDADGNLLGLLIEESRTNVVAYSEDFSQASWVKLGAGVASAAVVTGGFEAPTGTNTATRLQCNLNGGASSGDQSLIYDDLGGTGNHSMSFWVKSNTGSNQTFAFGNGLSAFTTGVATNEWQRFTYSGNLPVNRNIFIGARGSIGTDDTLDILIYGAQQESGSFPTSYIKTTGSTATRSADVASIPVSDFGYNQNEGTFFINITDVISNGNKDYFSVSSSGSFNPASFGLYGTPNTGSTLGYRRRNSAYDPAITSATDIQSTGSKVALSHDTSSLVISVDGVATETSSSNSIDTITEIAFGGSGHGVTGDVHSKHIKSIKYIPKRLSNAKLQELTS